MQIKIDFKKFQPWSGATDRWERIVNANKLGELEAILDDLYPDGMTETELNDLIWFNSDDVFRWLGMPAEDEEEEEELESD